MLRALFNGLVGAVSLTIAHQAMRRSVPDAPKMDKLGMEGLQKLYTAVGKEPPRGKALYNLALLGDIVMNTLYYSQVGSSRGFGAISKGISLGVSAGIGAASVPALLGMTKNASQKKPRMAALTVALYVFGGLAAALAAQCSSKRA